MRDIQGHIQPNTVGSRSPVFTGGHVVQRVVTLEQFLWGDSSTTDKEHSFSSTYPILPLGLKEEYKILCFTGYSLVGFIWSWSSE